VNLKSGVMESMPYFLNLTAYKECDGFGVHKAIYYALSEAMQGRLPTTGQQPLRAATSKLLTISPLTIFH
jgi:hypothetical protein